RLHGSAGDPAPQASTHCADAVLSRIANNMIMPPCGSRSLVFRQAEDGDALHRPLQVLPWANGSTGFRDLGGYVLCDSEPCTRSQHGVTIPVQRRSSDLGIRP